MPVVKRKCGEQWRQEQIPPWRFPVQRQVSKHVGPPAGVGSGARPERGHVDPGYSPHGGPARDTRRCCGSPSPRCPEGDARRVRPRRPPCHSRHSPGAGLSVRGQHVAAPPAPGPALGRAGAQGAGAELAGAGGCGAAPGRQGPLWRRRPGPRRPRSRSPVPLEHGLAGLAG